MTDRPTDMTFEAGLKRLEEILAQLEQGDLPLEESLALFEEGVGLVRVCSSRLEEAEGKIQKLLERADGTQVLEDQVSQEESS